MKYLGFQLSSPEGAKVNFQDWNDIQNKYNSITYKPKKGPPQKLFHNVVKEFIEFCGTYHIDHSKYKIVTPCHMDDDKWRQFDFEASEDVKISIHSLIYGHKSYEIIQRIIDIG